MPELNEPAMDLLKRYKNDLDIAGRSWSVFYAEAQKDVRMYVGDQLTAEQKKKKSNGKPALVINQIKKSVNMMIGHQMQNKSDIRVFPVEGEDERYCDIYNEAIKWIMVNTKGNREVSTAFKDGVMTGIGWLACEMDFSKDFINGDIKVKSENLFRIICDPEFKEDDASDARYFFRNAIIHKEEAKRMYPKSAEIIDGINSAVTSSEFDIEKLSFDNLQDHISITEYWYRKTETKTMVVDAMTGEVLEMPEDRAEMAIKLQPTLSIMKVNKPVIKLAIIANEQHILYDGDNPHGVDRYPFIPVLYTFTKSMNDYSWRIQGMIRDLRDLQSEKNKRRSVIMQSTMSQPLSGMIVEEESIVDESKMKGGPGAIIKYRRGAAVPKMINPPPIPSALLTLEEKSDVDMRNIGPNAEMLGEKQEAGAPGIVLQMRQRQGLTTVQEPFENLGMAYAALGTLIIDYINTFWSKEKLQAICESEVPPTWEMEKFSYKHNCIVDEVVNTSTSRMAVNLQLQELFAKGIPVDPVLMIETMDIPQQMKERMSAFIQKQMQPPPPPAGPALPPGMEGAIPPGMEGAIPPGM